MLLATLVNTSSRDYISFALRLSLFVIFVNVCLLCNSTKVPASPPVSCGNERPWPLGSDFIALLKATEFYGLSGRVKFNQETGMRQNFSLRIVDEYKESLSIYGYWTSGLADTDTRAG